MQNLEGSGTPVLYIGRTVLKGPPIWVAPLYLDVAANLRNFNGNANSDRRRRPSYALVTRTFHMPMLMSETAFEFVYLSDFL